MKSTPQINGMENKQTGMNKDRSYTFLNMPCFVCSISELKNILCNYKIKPNRNYNKTILKIQKQNKMNEPKNVSHFSISLA